MLHPAQVAQRAEQCEVEALLLQAGGVDARPVPEPWANGAGEAAQALGLGSLRVRSAAAGAATGADGVEADAAARVLWAPPPPRQQRPLPDGGADDEDEKCESSSISSCVREPSSSDAAAAAEHADGSAACGPSQQASADELERVWASLELSVPPLPSECKSTLDTAGHMPTAAAHAEQPPTPAIGEDQPPTPLGETSTEASSEQEAATSSDEDTVWADALAEALSACVLEQPASSGTSMEQSAAGELGAAVEQVAAAEQGAAAEYTSAAAGASSTTDGAAASPALTVLGRPVSAPAAMIQGAAATAAAAGVAGLAAAAALQSEIEPAPEAEEQPASSPLAAHAASLVRFSSQAWQRAAPQGARAVDRMRSGGDLWWLWEEEGPESTAVWMVGAGVVAVTSLLANFALSRFMRKLH